MLGVEGWGVGGVSWVGKIEGLAKPKIGTCLNVVTTDSNSSFFTKNQF